MVRPSATIDLKGDDADLKRALASGERRVNTFATNVSKSLKSAFKVVAIALPAAALAFGLKSIDAAREAIKQEKKLEAVIRATGKAAGFTAVELIDMADALQKITNFDADITVSAQAVLATFKEIKGGVFIEAIKSAQDMSAVLDTDLKSSVLQLGKALNDPIRGISALSRAGVSFTVGQKELIKTLQESGDIMGAQKIILAELKTEFGGAAEELVSPLTQAFFALGDVMDEVGRIALPKINEWATESTEALILLRDAIVGLDRLGKERELRRLDPEHTLLPDAPRLPGQVAVEFIVPEGLRDVLADTADVIVPDALGAVGRDVFDFIIPEMLREFFGIKNQGGDLNREQESRKKQLEKELFTVDDPGDVERVRAEHAIAEKKLEDARIASEQATQALAAAEEKAANSRKTLTAREFVAQAELEDARRKGAATTVDLAKAEADFTKARKKSIDEARKVVEGIDAFRQRLTTEVEGDPTRSADQKRLDDLVRTGQIGGTAREEIQSRIDDIERRKEQRALDEEGEALEERVATPFEKLEQTLAGFGDLFDAGAIDQETRNRATAAAEEAFQEARQADIPDFGPSGTAIQEDRGFQARFEGITAISNRIAAAAASRGPDDRAVDAAVKTAISTEASARKLADLDQHTQDMNGILIEIRDQPQPAAVAG